MPVPLIIAAVFIAIVGLLLWIGNRERRPTAMASHESLGEVRIFQTHWEATVGHTFVHKVIPVSGTGTQSGPSIAQTNTLLFIEQTGQRIFDAAVQAAKTYLTKTADADQCPDLEVSHIFLENEPGCFQVTLSSKSLASLLPDGLDVSFESDRVVAIEPAH